MNHTKGDNCRQDHHHNTGKRGRGPSSAFLHDPETVLAHLPLKPGHVFVDLGCGAGDYAMEASKIVGPAGRVIAVDKWQYLMDNLAEAITSRGLKNITLLTADITAPLLLEDNMADFVFLATVLHIFNLKKTGPVIFDQVSRILGPHGLLAVLECKKEDQNFGPPKHVRNSPEEVEAALIPHGFKKIKYTDLGYNYMVQFVRSH